MAQAIGGLHGAISDTYSRIPNPYPYNSQTTSTSPFIQNQGTLDPGDPNIYAPTANANAALMQSAYQRLGINPNPNQFYNSPYAGRGSALAGALQSLTGAEDRDQPYTNKAQTSVNEADTAGMASPLQRMLLEMEPERLTQLAQILQRAYGLSGNILTEQMGESDARRRQWLAYQGSKNSIFRSIPVVGGLIGGAGL